MRAFPQQVLAARPRPRAVVVDQHLASQVARREDATTGQAALAAVGNPRASTGHMTVMKGRGRSQAVTG